MACYTHDETLCPDWAAWLDKAIDLHRGDFPARFTLPDCQRFEWWQLGVQGACHYEVVEALRRLAIYHEGRRIMNPSAGALSGRSSWNRGVSVLTADICVPWR
jgi:hypothetical protein